MAVRELAPVTTAATPSPIFTNIIENDELWARVARSARSFRDVLLSHVGPMATLAVIAGQYNTHTIAGLFTNDGARIVESLCVPENVHDPVTKLVQNMALTAARQVEAVAHDGTTSSVLALCSLLNELSKLRRSATPQTPPYKVDMIRSLFSTLRDQLAEMRIDPTEDNLRTVGGLACRQDAAILDAAIQLGTTTPPGMSEFYHVLKTARKMDDKRIVASTDDLPLELRVDTIMESDAGAMMNDLSGTRFSTDTASLTVISPEYLGNPQCDWVPPLLEMLANVYASIAVTPEVPSLDASALGAGSMVILSPYRDDLNNRVIQIPNVTHFTPLGQHMTDQWTIPDLVRTINVTAATMGSPHRVLLLHPETHTSRRLYEKYIDNVLPAIMVNTFEITDQKHGRWAIMSSGPNKDIGLQIKVDFNGRKLCLGRVFAETGSHPEYVPDFLTTDADTPYLKALRDVYKLTTPDGTRVTDDPQAAAEIFQHFQGALRGMVQSQVTRVELYGPANQQLADEQVLHDTLGAMAVVINKGAVRGDALATLANAMLNNLADQDDTRHLKHILTALRDWYTGDVEAVNKHHPDWDRETALVTLVGAQEILRILEDVAVAMVNTTRLLDIEKK